MTTLAKALKELDATLDELKSLKNHCHEIEKLLGLYKASIQDLDKKLTASKQQIAVLEHDRDTWRAVAESK